MGTITYYEQELSQVNDEDGSPDKSKPPVRLEIMTTRFFGQNQIFMRITTPDGEEYNLPLDKEKINDLIDQAESAARYYRWRE